MDILHDWHKQKGGSNKTLLLLIGGAVICWTLWLVRNNMGFDKCQPNVMASLVSNFVNLDPSFAYFLYITSRGSHLLMPTTKFGQNHLAKFN